MSYDPLYQEICEYRPPPPPPPEHAPPTAAALQLLLQALRQYEPDIADEIVAQAQHRLHTLHPTLLLHSTQFQDLKTSVQRLPQGWRAEHRRRRLPERVMFLTTHIPLPHLTLLNDLIRPPWGRSDGPLDLMVRNIPDGCYKPLRRGIDPSMYPVDVLRHLHPDLEFRHRKRHADMDIRYFEELERAFPNDLARQLYAAAQDRIHHQRWPQARLGDLVGDATREYTRIKKASRIAACRLYPSPSH